MRIPLPIEKEIGAGDLVAKVTEAVGIKPCGGCQQRKHKWNSALQFVPMHHNWTVPPEVPEGWTLLKQCDKAMMLRHDSGLVIVWEIVDGQYRNSFSFRNFENAEKRQEVLCR
jgi:hypothetical protein